MISKMILYKRKIVDEMDSFVQQKCKEIDEVIDQLEQKESQMKRWHAKLNQAMENANLDIEERKKEIVNLIQ
ncbi:hypothetical protein RFI_25172 [Reticulomyxa filosa]|uniref:Uncharacterized protein n=1 Tax=Reticulomyxa filosa TaxID=46433 RepID=X6ME72_RETFI|nr:hypothetical protein RFI_25172 [Reticulomyxa filosa]|eukprot:ETO12204.1 hypothetical protein RFI_25172 [Reticulomyxa filosa]